MASLQGRKGRGGEGRLEGIPRCIGGSVLTLLSSTSGEKQACSPGAGHSAALPASTCQCPAAVKESPGQPAHQPLGLPQPQGNQSSLSGSPSVEMEIVLTGSQVSWLFVWKARP